MAYTGEQRDSNLQEPEFMSNVKIVDSGIIEEFGKWTLDEDGLLTIEGTGKMPDWDCDQCDYVRGVAWHRVREKIKSVRIADTVISIVAFAFYECDRLESINIPNSVTHIGENAFIFCDSLKYVKMPEKFNCLLFKNKYGISKKYVEFY